MFSLTKITRSTKMCRKSSRKCSSVVRKSRKPRNVDNLSRHYRQRLVNLLALRNIKTQNLPEMLTPPQSSDDDASSLMSVETCAPIHHVITKRSPINRLKLAERGRFGSRRMTRKSQRIEQRVPQKSCVVSEQQQPEFQPYTAQTSATQHFATLYGTAAPAPIFDLNSYAALTTIQQYHQYNAEYERVYAEYYQVQQRIEKIQRDYLLLTQRLQRVPQGSTVYQHLKQHIESVYQRKSSEETHKSEYLYNTLLHIRKLMTGYDAEPKSATERLAAAARDYLQRHQPSENFGSMAEFGTMWPRNEHFGNTLQFPMFRLTVDNLKLHDRQQELAEIQLNYLDKNSMPYNTGNGVPERQRMDNVDSDSDGGSTDTTSTDSESKNKDSIGRGSVVNDSIHSESKRFANFGDGESTDTDSTGSESKNKDSIGSGSVVNDSIHSESMDEDSIHSESMDTDPSYSESSQGYSSYGSADRNTNHSE